MRLWAEKGSDGSLALNPFPLSAVTMGSSLRQNSDRLTKFGEGHGVAIQILSHLFLMNGLQKLNCAITTNLLPTRSQLTRQLSLRVPS